VQGQVIQTEEPSRTQQFFDKAGPGTTPGCGDYVMTRRDYPRVRARSTVIVIFLFLLGEQNRRETCRQQHQGDPYPRESTIQRVTGRVHYSPASPVHVGCSTLAGRRFPGGMQHGALRVFSLKEKRRREEACQGTPVITRTLKRRGNGM